MDMKTIIVDLDRTLLRSDKTISPYTAAVLKTCRAHGSQIMVATARPLRDIRRYQERIAFDAMVVSNGARIICGDQQKEYGIRQQSAERLLECLSRDPALRITIETGDRAYSNKPVTEYETTICEDLLALVRREPVLKILVHIDNEETLPMVEQGLTEDLYHTVAIGTLIQIMSKAATKWNGIQEMLRISGGSPDRAVYFGDDNDDIEPLRNCGIGVAVSNGIEAAKAAADYVTDSNNEDGVAKFIERLIGNTHI